MSNVSAKISASRQETNRINTTKKMLVRRFPIVLIMCLLCSICMAEDLKKSVVLVEPEYEDMSDFFSSYALPLSRYGFRWESRTMMAYNNGVSGSGVVVQRGDTLVLLTNRHVVGLLLIQ